MRDFFQDMMLTKGFLPVLALVILFFSDRELLHSYNGKANLFILCLSWIAAYCYDSVILLIVIPVAVHCVNDAVGWMMEISLFDQPELVKFCYNCSDAFKDREAHTDFTYNLYEGDLTRPRKEAQLKKFEIILRALGLKSGDRLVDIGCGYGDWLKFCRSRGLLVVGINLSPVQVRRCRQESGLDVKLANFNTVHWDDPGLCNELYGNFDAVTYLGSLEHCVKYLQQNNSQAQDATFRGIFQLAHRLLDLDSAHGVIYTATLHQTKELDWYRSLCRYSLNRTMNGYYPFGDDGLARNGKEWFSEVSRSDTTEDYRLTAVIEQENWQTSYLPITARKIFRSLQWMLLDPYFMHRLLGVYIDSVMSFYGNNAWAKSYDKKYRDSVTFIKHFEILFRRH